jgi:hypothetical protein
MSDPKKLGRFKSSKTRANSLSNLRAPWPKGQTGNISGRPKASGITLAVAGQIAERIKVLDHLDSIRDQAKQLTPEVCREIAIVEGCKLLYDDKAEARTKAFLIRWLGEVGGLTNHIQQQHLHVYDSQTVNMIAGELNRLRLSHGNTQSEANTDNAVTNQ